MLNIFLQFQEETELPPGARLNESETILLEYELSNLLL